MPVCVLHMASSFRKAEYKLTEDITETKSTHGPLTACFFHFLASSFGRKFFRSNASRGVSFLVVRND